MDHSIADGDRVTLGDLAFAGGSFGRTDLPERDRDRLVRSIEYLLETVEGSLAALRAGHGPSVTDDPCSQMETALRAARF